MLATQPMACVGDAFGMNRQAAEDAKEPPRYLDEIARSVIGAAIEVHRRLGPGFLESVYEDALVIELEYRGIEVRRQVPITMSYRGYEIADSRLDLLVEEELIVEIKTVERLAAIHRAQLISYLQATRLQLGLLINFHVSVLQQGLRRVIWNA